jgi:hypothetical protein
VEDVRSRARGGAGGAGPLAVASGGDTQPLAGTRRPARALALPSQSADAQAVAALTALSQSPPPAAVVAAASAAKRARMADDAKVTISYGAPTSPGTMLALSPSNALIPMPVRRARAPQPAPC